MTATKKTTRRAAAKATKKARRPTAPSKAGRPRGPLKYQAILDEALKLKPDTYLAVAVPKGYTPQEYRNVLNVALRDRLEPLRTPGCNTTIRMAPPGSLGHRERSAYVYIYRYRGEYPERCRNAGTISKVPPVERRPRS